MYGNHYTYIIMSFSPKLGEFSTKYSFCNVYFAMNGKNRRKKCCPIFKDFLMDIIYVDNTFEI